MLRFLSGIPLIVHGLAHLGGFLASWMSGRAGFSDRPWIFSKGVRLGTTVARVISPVWLMAVTGLVGAGLGVILGKAWWAYLAAPSALVSLMVIGLWWKAVPLGAKVGAAFDVLILVALLPPWRERIIELVR